MIVYSYNNNYAFCTCADLKNELQNFIVFGSQWLCSFSLVSPLYAFPSYSFSPFLVEKLYLPFPWFIPSHLVGVVPTQALFFFMQTQKCIRMHMHTHKRQTFTVSSASVFFFFSFFLWLILCISNQFCCWEPETK